MPSLHREHDNQLVVKIQKVTNQFPFDIRTYTVQHRTGSPSVDFAHAVPKTIIYAVHTYTVLPEKILIFEVIVKFLEARSEVRPGMPAIPYVQSSYVDLCAMNMITHLPFWLEPLVAGNVSPGLAMSPCWWWPDGGKGWPVLGLRDPVLPVTE